jgi:hypothetical protein
MMMMMMILLAFLQTEIVTAWSKNNGKGAVTVRRSFKRKNKLTYSNSF